MVSLYKDDVKECVVKRIFHSFLIVIINFTLVFLPLANVNAAESLSLTSGDLVAPEIKHSPNTNIIPPGEFINIYATVTDNVGVKTVSVFYRQKASSAKFKRIKMLENLKSSFYSVMLPGVDAIGVEYYIQATDYAGNTILRGHTFSPLTLIVSEDAIPQKDPRERGIVLTGSPEQVPSKGISKWVWIGLGVLALSGLSGGGSDEGTGPATGTVTINGPTP